MSDAAVIDPTVTAPNGTPPAPTDWRGMMTDDLKADPVVSGWAEKATEKDVPALIKGYAHLFKSQGGKIALPGKDAKPEEVTAIKSRLIEAGLLPKPITDPKEYAIAKPENLPAGVEWSDELSGKLASTLHKYQVPKEAVADLLALHLESMGNASKTLTINKEQAMAQIKAEHGEKYDERAEMVTRMLPGLFTQDAMDFMDETGLGDDPRFISVLMKLAPLAMQDSSFVESIPRKGGEISGETAKEEYAKIISDPKHPMHEGYLRRDPKVEQHINELYRAAYGNLKATT